MTSRSEDDTFDNSPSDRGGRVHRIVSAPGSERPLAKEQSRSASVTNVYTIFQ